MKFQERFESLGLDERTLQMASTATVAPSATTLDLSELMELLPEIGHVSELELMDKLDEGGMGVISVARQRALGRHVAVKAPKETGNQRAAQGLVQEAHVTGLLEHPNVVPVHNLGRNLTGDPLLVMKRIQGVSWLKILQDPELAPVASPDLAWHIHILIQVSNALRIAHRRQIVHRDIKPENIMIGEFGEVYLMDWGLALYLGDVEESPYLPRRESASGLAGTPAYMAPEMTLDDASEVDFTTDVYLLGATLYHVVEGKPPHGAESLFESLRLAFEGALPAFSEHWPDFLKDIATRALAPEKGERFASVEAFQRELEVYLEVRGSIALTRASSETLDEVVSSELGDSERSERLAEARFGFRQALAQWSGNEAAAQGLRQTEIQLFRYHLERGHLDLAESILANLDPPPPECVEALDRAKKERDALSERVEDLERWVRELDPRVGGAARALLVLGLGGFWVGTAIWSHLNLDLSAPSRTLEDTIWWMVRTVGAGFAMIFLLRKMLFKTESNRRIMYVVIGMLFAMLASRFSGFLADIPIWETARAELAMYAMAVIALGMMTKIRIAYACVTHFAASLLAASFPEYTYLFIAASNTLTFIWVGFHWYTPRSASN